MCKSLLPTPPSSAIIDKSNTYGNFLVVSFFQRTVNSKSPVRAFFFRLFSSVRPPHARVRWPVKFERSDAFCDVPFKRTSSPSAEISYSTTPCGIPSASSTRRCSQCGSLASASFSIASRASSSSLTFFISALFTFNGDSASFSASCALSSR